MLTEDLSGFSSAVAIINKNHMAMTGGRMRDDVAQGIPILALKDFEIYSWARR